MELEAERNAIELAVVSVNQQLQNVADAVMELPLAHFNEVMDQIRAIVEGQKNNSSSAPICDRRQNST
jgi:hypothetical protein